MTRKGWHSRNCLPHFDSQDVIQFVTFRLADSLPAEAVATLRDAERSETLRHEMLDCGWGQCWLRSESIASLVEDAFLAFDGVRYRLHAWTVMPNHVHVLFGVDYRPWSNRWLLEAFHGTQGQRDAGAIRRILAKRVLGSLHQK